MSSVISEPFPGPFALVNGQVVLPEAVRSGMAVVVQAGRIAGVGPVGDLSESLPRVDMGGRYVCPGLIDIHIHGAVGRTFNEPEAEAWQRILELQARCGVTAIVPTLATAALDNLTACLALAPTFIETRGRRSQVLGVHVEGPYFNPAQSGAQSPAYLRRPDDGSVEALLDHAAVIRVFTLAPELPGAVPLIRRLDRLGIVPAAGHSAATDSDVLEAMAAGLRHAIHLWSSQSSVVRQGPWRLPGLLEASLTFPELTGEIIADNRHLPPTLMRLAYLCKGPDRLCLVSDASRGAGLPDGARYTELGLDCEVRSGVAMLRDQTAFAGSTTFLNQMVRILAQELQMPLPEVVCMAALTPARVIGLAHCKGAIQAGYDADLAVFDEDFTAWNTIIGGRWVQDAPPAAQSAEAMQ